MAPKIENLELEGVDGEALDALQADDDATRRAPSASAPLGIAALGEPQVPDAPEPDDDSPEVLTDELDVDDFAVVGVSWRRTPGVDDTDVAVQLRVRSDGEWGPWEVLGVADEGPDAGTAEAARMAERTGTSPLVVLEADGVQVRIDTPQGVAPRDVQVSLVDPGTSRADDTVHSDAVPVATATASGTQPQIVTREQWGADESLTSGRPVVNHTVKALVVHHTAGSNSYSREQAVQQIRGIYAYHTKTLGWADIGYNLLVDRYGTVYEGRRGSIDQAIQGAHSGGFNRDTYGVSLMGNFEVAEPPAAAVAAMTRVIGWKMGQYGTNPLGTTTLVSAGGGTSRYAAGSVVRLPALLGHRDVGQTSCPGRYLYPKMATMRAEAADIAARTAPTLMGSFPRDWTGDQIPDVMSSNPSGRLWSYPGSGSGSFEEPQLIGRGWGTRTLVTQVGDWDGDGNRDLVGRETDTGRLWLYPGDGEGGFIRGYNIGGNWRVIDALIGVGDWDGDGAPDLLARREDDGTLWLYPGTGAGGWGVPRRVAANFDQYDILTAVGDWDRDGSPDIVARERGTGELHWYRQTAGGGIQYAKRIGTGWQDFDMIHGPGDWDASRGVDLLARKSNGRVILYSGDGNGGFSGSRQVGHGWGYMRFVQ
ncbi:FG-GAP-like repeat-containing protein [Quadrisphaera sp. GCM10027208]|uniref:FG-GAP-like repeat-containing protein n=1 Tax=Quadrisphaera sp. GCM10027208 TaxID=3273423 RepID=UPI003623829C